MTHDFIKESAGATPAHWPRLRATGGRSKTGGLSLVRQRARIVASDRGAAESALGHVHRVNHVPRS